MIRLHSLTKWCENYAPITNADKVVLDEIIPKAGMTVSVEISSFEYVVEGDSYLLWCPPNSELNGWDCCPSEILRSYLVEGYIIHSKDETYECKVKAVIPLRNALDSASSSLEFKFPRCGEIDGGSFNLWERAFSLQVARVGNYIYLVGSQCETCLEAILLEESSQLYILYHATIPPATTETVITKYALTAEEQIFFVKLISKAEEIVEFKASYLV